MSENRTPQIPTELTDAFRAIPPRVVLLVGAGISRRVKRGNGQPFPSWVELVRELLHWASTQGFSFTVEQSGAIEALLRRGDSLSLIHAAGWLKAYVGKPLFAEFMSKTLASVPKITSPTHELLSRLPIRGTVTFNYDCLLETAFRLPPYAVATQDDEPILSAILKGDRTPFLVKAHGDVGRPDTLVFGHDDYRRVIHQNLAYRAVLTTLFEQNVVLSVGFGLDDPDLEYLYEQLLVTLPSVPLRIFALVPRGRINAVLRDLWLRERKLRLIEYEAVDAHHGEVDDFLHKLSREIAAPIAQGPVVLTDAARAPKFTPFVESMRTRLARSWRKLENRLADASDTYSLARERSQVIDELIKEILEESMRHAAMPADGFAVIARGGYGKGHLSSNSDIDITLLHTEPRQKEAEALFSIFLLHLRDTVGAVKLKALPIVNKIQECQDHWRQTDSLVSFTFSRLILGDLNLHCELRMKWRKHICSMPLQLLLGGLRKARLNLEVEEFQPTLLNIKNCAGGILEVMLVHFLEEIILVRGLPMPLPVTSTSTDDLDTCLSHLLLVRERIFAANKTLVLDRTQAPSGEMNYEDWCQLTKCRLSVRQRFIAALLNLGVSLEVKSL